MELCGQHMNAELIDTKYAGLPNIEILRRLSDRELSPEQLEQYSLRKEALYRDIVRSVPGGAGLVPGAEDLFDFLKANRIPSAIASASIIENITFFVEIFHLDKWFDMDRIVYDNNTYKNKVMMFRDAFDRIGCGRDVLIFEDSLSGITCAGEAGAAVVAIRKKTMEPHYGKFSHIVDIVEDLQGAEKYFM